MQCIGLMIGTMVVASSLSACGAGHGKAEQRGPDKVLDRQRERINLHACDEHKITRIERPVLLGKDQSAGSFDYAYQYVPPQRPELPTMVLIPGGPGQASIGQEELWSAELPADYGLLLTDPRGVGCNAPADEHTAFIPGFYTSRGVASDVNAAIKDAGLSNYFLYGISYGTVVATEAAAKAAADGTSEPRFVVLEGTVGRAFKAEEVGAEAARQWQEKLAASPEVKKAFTAEPLPLSLEPEQWAETIQAALSYGRMSDPDARKEVDLLDDLVARAISHDSQQQSSARTFIKKLLNEDDAGQSKPGFQVFYLTIACREIWARLPKALTLRSGLLAYSGGNLCEENPQFTYHLGSEAYDSAQWQVKAPLYYLQGDKDTNTPLALATYHQLHQTASARAEMAVVHEASHNPLEISIPTCKKSVFAGLAAGKGLRESLRGCQWSPGISLQTVHGGLATSAPLSDLLSTF